MPENYDYRYPNAGSYALLPTSKQHGAFHWQGRTLRHGYIYGYKKVAGAGSIFNEAGVGALGVLAKAAGNRQVDFNNCKMFQFNPPGLSLTASMIAVENADIGLDGGALPPVGVGLASSSLELFFDRTEEIALANNGKADEKWRDVGVQADLYDFFRVISGGDESALGTYTEEPPDTGGGFFPEGWGSIRKESTNRITGELFDAAIAGNSVQFKPFVVVFNPNLAVHVSRMTSFTFTYLRFTPDLVPTSVKMEIGLEITNMGTKAHAIASGGPGGATGTTSSTSTEQPPPGVLQLSTMFKDW